MINSINVYQRKFSRKLVFILTFLTQVLSFKRIDNPLNFILNPSFYIILTGVSIAKFFFCIIPRILFEEMILMNELEGYMQYMQKVYYRVIPGI